LTLAPSPEETPLTSPTNISAQRVLVDLATRSYAIEIEAGLQKKLASLLDRWIADEHVILVTDDVVGPLYLEDAVEQLNSAARRADPIIVPTGEQSKSVATCDQLWQKMVDLRTDRKSVVIALGGGVVGDLAGFLAASFARGLRFIQIPTTLLAQVDSSVGGKVGINLPQAKNMVGAFWQPETVLIDPLVLATLDVANYRAGMAEVIKYGLIMDKPLFEFLELSTDAVNRRDPETLTKIIAWCCQCKATVVEEDERETSGRRAILNYGHTYGHAIEAVFGYGEYLHGQAISIGMTCAGRLARNLGMVDQAFLDRQTRLFQAVGLPVDCPASRHDELLASMKHDKKVSRGKLMLILPTAIGTVDQFVAPDDETIRRSFEND
jgi:3-dehydroquinate synthase